MSSLDKVPVQFEDDALSGTSTVVTNIFPNPAAGKSRFFGHSTGTEDQQVMINESVAHKKCREQIGSKFGCIPVSEIVSFDGTPTYLKEVPNIIQAHNLIRNSGLPNFLGLRIPVATRLKVDTWRYYLSDYFDQQLPDLIQFVFPLDFDRDRVLGLTEDNHPSAKTFGEDIDAYIAEELSYGAMMGPFYVPPFSLHISPFLTREKSGSDTRRTIMDLSWPK